VSDASLHPTLASFAAARAAATPDAAAFIEGERRKPTA
jgi:hypothetical protein